MGYSILIFDEVWLSRFPKDEKNNKIYTLEGDLKDKIKEEAKLTESNKKLKSLKNKYLQDILDLSEKIQKNPHDKSLILKMDSIRKKITQINKQILKNEDLLFELPRQIKKINSDLMEETIRICCNLMNKFQEEINQIEPEIERISQRLNYLTEKRHDERDKLNKVSKLLNSLVGPEMMDFLDCSENHI